MDDLERGDPAIDLLHLATEPGRGTSWAHQGQELNVILVVFDEGGGVGEHVNDEVEVLIVGIAGEGVVTVDGHSVILRSGDLLVIPKGARRATRSTGGRFAYLTCHRRRGHLRPMPIGDSAR